LITYQQRDPDLDDSPSVQNLLQQQAAMYDGSASSYDAARFTDYPGRYDLLEAEVFIRELIANVMRTPSQEGAPLISRVGKGKQRSPSRKLAATWRRSMAPHRCYTTAAPGS